MQETIQEIHEENNYNWPCEHPNHQSSFTNNGMRQEFQLNRILNNNRMHVKDDADSKLPTYEEITRNNSKY